MSSSSQRGDGDGFVLADELAAHREEGYVINNELDASSMSAYLDALVDSLSLSPSAIDNEDTFDQIKSFLRHFSSLSGPHRSKLLDALTSAYKVQLHAATHDLKSEGIERYKEHAEMLEKYAFSLQWLTNVAEKASNSAEERSAAEAATSGRVGTKAKSAALARSGWDWQRAILVILDTLNKSLELSTSILFPLSAAKDAFISGCVLRPALLLQENPAHLKVAAIKEAIFKVVCNCVKNHGQAFAVQTSIMQALTYYDHLAEPMAELLALLGRDYDYERLGDEVLREVAAKEFGGLDTKGPKCFAAFLERIAEESPRSVLRNISLLNKHLDSESYHMRKAMLEVLGLLIKDLSSTDDALPASIEQGDNDVNDEDAEGQGDARGERADGRKRQIEQFWTLICKRFLDLSSFVRVRCIEVCAKLCDLPAKFPSQRNQLVDLSIQSLLDSTKSTRKAAIGLLARLILTHPYGLMHGGELELVEWSKRLEAIDEQLKEFDGLLDLPAEEGMDETITADHVEGTKDESEEEGEDSSQMEGAEGDIEDKKAKDKGKKPRASINLDTLAAKLSTEDAEKVVRLRLTRRYYVDAISFIKKLADAIPHLSQLLVSTSKAEVLESMDFFQVAYEYKVPGAEVGVRKMIHMIWSKDNNSTEDGKELRGIKSRLIEVYRTLYFEPLSTLNGRDNVNRIARNLVERTFGATLAELTSLEELVSTMCGEGMIHEDVVEKLWSVYASPKPIPRGQRRGAIMILSMMAIARKEIVAEHIDTLLSVGLGAQGAKDVVLAKYTCIALSRVGGSVKKVKGALSDEQVRFPMTHPMFARFGAAIQWPSGSGSWFSLAENAIQSIYLLGQQPDALCSELIKQMTLRVFGPGGPSHSRAGTASVPATPGGPMAEEPSSGGTSSASAFSLAQLLFVVGQVALKQIVYLERVEREFKRRKAEEDKQKVLTSKDNNADSGKADPAPGKPKISKRGKGKTAEPAEEEGDELDQIAGNAEDPIQETMGEVKEKELLYGSHSLLAIYGPVVAHICSNPTAYSNEHLRKAAVLTLCKFMCISSTFCEENLPLVLSILSTSQDAIVRSNVVIALGDMAVSFSSLVDENSDKLYAGLGDSDLGVKKHTLMVLTHLILKTMIKPKGQLGEMAKCLEDEEERVSDLAKLFFTELATNQNVVYKNNLLDIISHLSSGERAVDEDTFAKVMRFILTFVKDGEADNVVERLCQRFQDTNQERFRFTTPERQWRDIAFCLSLLPYKDKAVKRLIEAVPFYKDKLHDEVVFKRFSEILTKVRSSRSAAPGTTSVTEADLQEFEQVLEAARLHGLNDAEIEEATQAKLAKSRRKRGTAATGPSASSTQPRRRVGARRTPRESVASEGMEAS